MKLSIEHTLPCGHTLQQSAVDDGSSDNATATYDHHAGALRYWLETRIREHACELVSDKNPAGSRHIAAAIERVKE